MKEQLFIANVYKKEVAITKSFYLWKNVSNLYFFIDKSIFARKIER